MMQEVVHGSAGANSVINSNIELSSSVFTDLLSIAVELSDAESLNVKVNPSTTDSSTLDSIIVSSITNADSSAITVGSSDGGCDKGTFSNSSNVDVESPAIIVIPNSIDCSTSDSLSIQSTAIAAPNCIAVETNQISDNIPFQLDNETGIVSTNIDASTDVTDGLAISSFVYCACLLRGIRYYTFLITI